MGLLPVINITKLPQEGMARGPSHGNSRDYQGDNTDFHNFTISFILIHLKHPFFFGIKQIGLYYIFFNMLLNLF